jgi:hypothetical protein
MTDLREIPRRDLQKLSSYLDGELSPKEAKRLETRLRANPELRGALEELRGTVRLLKALPEVRAPRNFTLTREMVGLPEPRPAYPILRLATALTVAAFLVTVGVDVLMRGAYGALAPRAAPESRAMEMALDAERTEEGAEAEMLEAPSMAQGVPSEEAPGEPEAGEGPLFQGPPGTPLAAQVAPEEGEANKMAATPEGPGRALGSGTPRAPAGTTAPTSPGEMAELEPSETPLLLGGGGAPPSATPMPPLATTPPAGTPSPVPVRSLEIGLGALALVLLGFTLLARREPR